MNKVQLSDLRQLMREGKSVQQCAMDLGVSMKTINRHIPRLSALPSRLPLTSVAAAIKPYGFVYVFGAQNLVKIGMTRYSVYRRWHGIKTANPWLERPLYVTGPLLGNVIRVERACHKELRSYHVTGEWFECARTLAVEIVQRIEKESSTWND